MTERPSSSPRSGGRDSSLIGALLSGRYRIEERIAQTSTGELYRAEHALMRKRIAVKIMSPEAASRPEALARFEREAIAGAHVEHPNVAAAKDFGVLDNGAHFLVLEYLDGPTLRQVMRGGPLPLPRVVHIARQLALALDAAHAKGIVHRAVMPENVHLVERGGDRDVVKLIDFGAALLPADLISSSAPPERVGRIATPMAVPAALDYTAPELVQGTLADGRADLYALGVVMVELATGARPRAGQRGASARLLPGSPELDALIRAMLEEDPARRPAAALEVVEALDAIYRPAGPARRASAASLASVDLGRSSRTSITDAGSLTALGIPPPMAPRLDLRSVPRPILVAAGGLIAIVFVVVSAIALRAPFPPDEEAAADAGSPRASALGHVVPAETSSTSDAQAAAGAPAPAQPGRSEVLAQLNKQITSGRFKEALASLERLLALDPKAPQDREVRATIVELAMRIMLVEGPEPDRMFELITKEMGTTGVDILYELVTTKGGSRAAARAEQVLKDEDVREAGTPALRIAYDLRYARRCDDKVKLFARAETDGDHRTLGQLQMLNRSCRRRDECCLHNDPRLRATMDAIKERIGAR